MPAFSLERTAQAQEKLPQWLLKAEQKRARTDTPSPSPLQALQDKPAVLAIQDTKIDAQPVSELYQSHQEAQEATHQEAQEAIQEADSDSQESQEATKEAESDSSSSSSPSTSSPIWKLRDTRAIVREVTEAFGLMREPLAETCAECTTALDHIQGLLNKALQ